MYVSQSRRHSATDNNRLSRDVAGVVRHEECNSARTLLWVPKSETQWLILIANIQSSGLFKALYSVADLFSQTLYPHLRETSSHTANN